ncbi:MAG: PLxRFG domain-containing protein, partial [Lysobacter sp.]|nr:PLxRFG domain-containing protein [Lysobacter sp.]
RVAGLDISIENPAGSKRREEWPALAHHYGYIKGTIGKDKDHVDVFLTEHAADTQRPVFVIDQRTQDGRFDEHKVVLGASNMAAARKAYLANYSKGWKGVGRVTQMTHAEFEQWVRDPNNTTRPAAASFTPAAKTAEQAPTAPTPTAAATEPKARQVTADAAFAANRAAIKAKGLKKGDAVSFTSNGRTFTGKILSLGDAEQGVVAVGVEGARGVADYHVAAAQLTKGVGEPGDAGAGATTTAPAPAASAASAPQPRVRMVRGTKEFVASDRSTLEAYFQPGREIPGYGGKDRVVSFDWNGGNWGVKVQGLTFNGKDVSHEAPRTHSTLPTQKELHAVFGSAAQYSSTRKPKGPVARKTSPATALFSKAGRAGSDRADWQEFPQAVIAEPFGPGQQQLRTHPDYEAAKGGDRAAAARLVGDRLTPEAVQRVRDMIGDRKPILVAVHAEEASGRNQIPLAYASALGQALGLPVDREIVQSVRAHHTAAGAFHRIAFQAVFDGPVERGADYLVIDDALTMGGTLANLRGHIEANGGHVVGATVLTGHPNGATMALQPATAQRLRETFGNDLDRYLENEFGFDSSRLTEGEAGHILAARSLDAIRDRISQARQAAGGGLDGRLLRSASDRTQPQGRLTLERAQQLKTELTQHWGDNAPSIRLVASADDLPAAVKADPDFRRVEGVYNGSPVIWLNVGRIQNEQRFAQVLAHEALGHYGVERVVGAEQWGRIADSIEALRQRGASAQLRRIFSEIEDRQPGLDRDTFAREAIAFMAEKGIRNSFVARVMSAVRRFLRRVMPSARWSETEIRGLLTQAESFLHQQAATPAERRALVQRYAFSAADNPQYGESGLQVDETPVDRDFVAGLSPAERKSPAMGAFANGLWHELGTASPFFKDWFGDSKVVDGKGEPLKVYHGTGEEFAAFDPGRAGKSTGHMTARLGIFFDARKEKAEHYARIATNDVPAEQHVYEVYLAIQHPYEMSKAQFMDVEGTDDATALRARLEREGYDGIRLPDIGQWIAFRADQIKATENRGTFDRSDNRMLFSKAPGDVVDDLAAVTREATQFDASIIDKARAALKSATPEGLATLAKKVKDRTRGSWLGFLTTRHLTELGSDHFATMHHYSDYLAEMGADRNALQQEGEDVAESVRKWAGKNQPAARAMFDLMHDATIQGVDPAESFQPLQFRYAGQLHEATPKNVREALRAIKEQMRGRAGDNKTDMLAEAKVIRGMPARDKARRQTYPTLVERWNSLSPEAQQHYRVMRDLYAKRSKQVEDALVQRIEDLRGDQAGKHKARLIATIRAQFESARLQGVYFPLQRFGQYFVAGERDGTNTFQMFENQDELERAVKGLRERGFTVVAQGRKGEQRAKDAPSGTFVADVLEKLNKAGASEKMQDEIYQLYLQSLPELSMRKHSIHRQTVPGFDPDALRAFAFNMHHGAHQLARLRYSHKLQSVLDTLREQQEARRREAGGDTRAIVAGDVILDELAQRHEWISNPQASALVNKISSAGFLYYLGVTPAAALVNLTQVPFLALPHLGSRFGGVKAMNALLAGMKDSVRTGGHIQRTLTDSEELRAHAYLQRAGALDKTQAHNLAGIAEGGLAGYNPAWATAMKWVGMPFHVAEVINREATGMAAYRLARGQGMGFDEAVKFAANAIQDTMFDYSNQNRARFMQDGWKKVLLMFRQYSLNMTWHMGRMLWQATKGESPDVKRIARRNLAGVLCMSPLFSAVLGLPLMSV